METYCVVAGGWSAKGTDWARLPGTKIGVNDAGLLSGADVIVSMDRLWTENRWAQLQHRHKPTWLRRSAIQNVLRSWPTEPPPHWCVVFENDHRSTKFVPLPEQDRPRVLNGTNSGFCALNLAYQFAGKGSRVLLIGFDMCRGPRGETYWHEPYEWVAHQRGATTDGKYRVWAEEFANAAKAFEKRGVKVINCSIPSAIGNWPKKPIEGFYV